jgi:hypothetical protein
MGKDKEGSGSGLIGSNIVVVVWRKTRKKPPIRIADL